MATFFALVPALFLVRFYRRGIINKSLTSKPCDDLSGFPAPSSKFACNEKPQHINITAIPTTEGGQFDFCCRVPSTTRPFSLPFFLWSFAGLTTRPSDTPFTCLDIERSPNDIQNLAAPSSRRVCVLGVLLRFSLASHALLLIGLTLIPANDTSFFQL